MRMLKLLGVCGLAMLGFSVTATDLTWVNWSGDLKASTASNWSPAQVPQAGDNLYIYYDGSGTKYWHNDLDIEYGHIDLVITNTSSSRVDFDQKEVRVANGISVLGNGGTLYGRTAITGSGDFEVDCHGGTVYLATSPTGANVYSGNFIIKTGTLNAQAANVLGDETRHGYVYLHAHSTANDKKGVFGNSGTWTMWNDFYYDNDSSNYSFAPSSSIRYNGKLYFRGGSGTIQHPGGGNVIKFYGKWIRWAPEGTAKNTTVLYLFGRNPGFEFLGGYEDDMAPMTIYNDGGNVTNIATISCKVDLPYGIKFNSRGKAVFTVDDAYASGLPLQLSSGSVVDLNGTHQRIGNVTLKSGLTATIQSSTAGGEMAWAPTNSTTLTSSLAGSMNLVMDAAAITGTVASTSAMTGALVASNGTLVVDSSASLPNVSDIVIREGATMVVNTANVGQNSAFHIVDGANLEIASGVVLTVGKAYKNGERMAAQDYQYGDGTLRVASVYYVWTGAGGDGDLANSANWSGDGYPQGDDDVRFTSTPTVPLTGSLTVGKITVADQVAVELAAGATLSAPEYAFGADASITSSAAATVKITGAGSYTGLPVSGYVTVAVDAGAGNTVTLAGTVTAETIAVASGSLVLATKAVSKSLVLTAASAGQIAVSAGITADCFTCKIGDTWQNPGQVQFGEGYLQVYASGAPATATYVWTGGAGAEDTSIFTAANWQGGVAPELGVGNVSVSFPNGGTVDIPTNTEARVYSLSVASELAVTGSGKLMVGAGGAALSGTAPITIAPTVEFMAGDQTWNFSGKDVNLKFMGNLVAHPRVGKDGEVIFATAITTATTGSRSFVWFERDNPDLDCHVVISNVVCDIRQPQTFKAEYGVTIYNARYEFTQGPHMFRRQMEVNFPVTLYDHYRELVDCTDHNNTSITFNYPVKFLRSGDYSTEAAGNVTVRDVVIFNAPVYAGPGLVFNNVADKEYGKGVYFNDNVVVTEPTEANNDFRNSSGPLYLKGAANEYPSLIRLTGSGILGCLAENTLVSDATVIFYGKSAEVDLHGFNQSIPSLWANWGDTGCSYVRSNGKRTVLTLTNPTSPFAYAMTYPFAFTDGAGVEFVLSAGKTVTFARAQSLTRGPLIVDGGTVAFAADASWHGRSEVTIKSGATIQTNAAETFGDETDGYRTALTIENGGYLNLSNNETVKSLIYNDNVCQPGTYGKSGSGADYELSCFTGDGILTVTGLPATGLIMMVK